MRATWSDAFDDELPVAGFPALFIVDGEVGIAEVTINRREQVTAASPDAFDLYEPAEPTAEPVRGPPAPQPRWQAPPVESPAQVEATVARLAPPTPSLRADGLRAVLSEQRQRRRRSLLDGWAVLTANTTMPLTVAEHFTEKFPEVDTGRVTLVWDAFLQWLRIQGRKYPTQHAMPAHSVEMVLRMLRADRNAWNGVRKQWPVNLDHLFVNLGRLWTPGDALAPLQATWSDAFYDEPPKSKTPLLFHVDADIGIRDARTYQAFCKRNNCEPPEGVICLHTAFVLPPSGQGGGGS